MKNKFVKRVLAMVMTFCLLLTMIPLNFDTTNVEAVSGVNSLTCSSYISNSTARNYIDTMMRYYINSNSTLQNTLNNGQSVVFMFEGGSDNYWNGSDYTSSAYDVRDQAVCFVVKMNSNGNAYIAFCSEMCSSIPGEPTWCTNGVAYSGSTTILDGIYPFYTWNHTGPYAAFQINMSATNGYAYYTPPQNLNGYKAGASGINIHTRSTNIAAGSALGWAWSEGCQVIGNGGDSSNEFNAFVKSITGISWNPWISWPSKILNTWATTGSSMGYYVLDRQLALSNISGTQYGSGSLRALYNQTALTNITSASTAARNAAGATISDYMSKCTFYPTYGSITITGIDVWGRTYPCYSSVNSGSAAISVYNAGDKLIATGMYKNTDGEYWYRFTSASGSTLYINGAYADFTESYTSDITLTGHTKPNGHVKGSSFAVDGTIKTTYNQLTAVSAYVYSGFGQNGNAATGHRATTSTNSYSLSGSAVDNNVLMGILNTGNYTMVVSAEYKYYHANGGKLNTLTGKMDLAEDYFMVIPSSVSQSTCSHTYQTYFTNAVNCTENGYSIKACTTCGYIGAKTATTGNHTWGGWTTVNATCTTDGTKTRTCSVCGFKETETIAATGHNYTSQSYPATCIEYAHTRYTCTKCADTYTVSTGVSTEWSENKPQGVDDSLIETKTQYRYSQYEQIKNYESSMEGYTLFNMEWESQGQKTQECVKSWPAGFSTANSLYSKYNVAPKSNYTDGYHNKTEVNSDEIVGYLYYHWCAGRVIGGGPYNSLTSKVQTGTYGAFHAFYSTANPSTMATASDGSVTNPNASCCTDSWWYYNVPVYKQTYTDYKALYTHSRWTPWSDWSDTEYTEAWDRDVESRTMYRSTISGQLGPHNYANGVCTVCSKAEPDYYLFGFINGADYACNDDAENLGIYKFTSNKLTVKFTENSYIGVKTGDNAEWYMTDGYLGENVTSAKLYNNANSDINADKLFVPGGRQITFTLAYNGDGTYTLSYTFGDCDHENHNTDGVCTACGEKTDHTYEDGKCTVCSKTEPVYYLFGFINGADYEGSDYRFDNRGKLIATFSDNSYVAVKTGDNSKWYMTDGYPGDNATSATLYDAGTLDGKGDRLFVPKGREITFTLTDNGDNTFVLSYVAAQCDHNKHDTDGVCTSCGEEVGHTNVNGICTVCGYNCPHNWGTDDVCTICGKIKSVYYLYGFINGADYDGLDYQFVDGILSVKFTGATYIAVKTGDNANRYMTDGYQGDNVTSAVLYNTKLLGDTADKLFVPMGREITFTLTDNGDGSLILSYVAAPCNHESHNINGICTICGENVGHTNIDGVCSVCGRNCNHNWVDGKCSSCGKAEPQYYLFGHINSNDYEGTDYKFVGGKLTVTFIDTSYIAVKTGDNLRYMTNGYQGDSITSVTLYNDALLGDKADKMYIPGGVQITFTLIENDDNTYTLSYTAGDCKHLSHNTDGICKYCSQTVEHIFKDGSCSICGLACKHSYQNGKCTVCSKAEPDYYLFGFINGADYGDGSDAENLGIYKFNKGKLVVVFTDNSYVAVKTGDNCIRYMTDGYSEGVTTVTLYDTNNGIDADKIFIPKGRLVTFTLVNNGDGSITLTYEVAPCYHVTHNTDGVCYTCGESVEHTYNNKMCTICGVSCRHFWYDSKCPVCNSVCEHNFINGSCTLCGFECEHSYENGVCSGCELKCVHSYENGECSVCHIVCLHKWLDGECSVCDVVCEHNYESGTCTVCSTKCVHDYNTGICTICGTVCQHKWTNSVCSICDINCKHMWSDGKCSSCGIVCDHDFISGKCNTCSTVCNHNFAGDTCQNCNMKCTHSYKNGVCTVCGTNCTHSFSDETCTLCGYSCSFYLVGDINGVVVGYNDDYRNTGNYKFTNGSITVAINSDSYVFVKTADNLGWYMANSPISSDSAVLYNTKYNAADSMLFIPGGTVVTLTLTPGTNDTLTLNYEVDEILSAAKTPEYYDYNADTLVSTGFSLRQKAYASAYAADADDSISVSYAANLSVKTTQTVNLMSSPSIGSSSVARYTVPAGTMLTAVKLHKNTSGSYWYEVLYYNITLYVDATATTVVNHLTGDVAVTGLQSPASLTYGGSFPIKGNISSTLNDIGIVTAAMYNGSNLTKTPALKSSDNANGKSYNLSNSTVDYYMDFGNLSAGVYTYLLTAEAISYYIDDNNTLKTSKTIVTLDTKQCVVTNGNNPNPVLHKGIDISVWNGNVDWAKVATQVDFVVLRASWEYTMDEKFIQNADGCVANGIPFGVYVYSYAENREEAVAEAQAVLNMVSGYDLKLPIFFDFEDEIQMVLSTSLQQEIVKAFCDTISAAGYQPGIYTFQWVLTNTLTDAYFKTLPTWVAEIKSGYTNYKGGLWMWQYSWTGQFDGISGDVDCNYMYTELPGTASSDTSYLSRCEYYPSNMSATTNVSCSMRQYPSTDFSIISTLSKDAEVHITGLYKNTYGNLWYQVEYNGVTGYLGAESINIKEFLYDDISITNPDMADNLNSGQGYYIDGDLSSTYNNLDTVYAKVYSGEDTLGTPVLNSSYSPNSKEYSLYKSDVDYGLWFGTQSTGYYTYEISVDVKTYYYDNGSLASKTENVVVWTKPYTVNNATITPPDNATCNHTQVTDPAVEAGCTTTGLTAGSHCSKCGVVFTVQETIPAKGHKYTSKNCEANCQEGAHTMFTCQNCGDTYKEYIFDGASQWQETKPEGIDDSLIETKTQYRYSQYEQIKNYEPSMEGYTLFNMEWESQGQKTQECVKSWPAGFSAANSLYSKYNVAPKSNYTDNYYNKTEVNSDEIVGYLYYHWCAGRVIGGGPYNSFTSKVQTGTYGAFHAFYSTANPSTMATASDGSVTNPNASCCTDSWWYYNVPVYKQTYTDYKALYTHSRWTPWSDWSDTEYTEAWDRDVESRIMYRTKTAELGDHKFENGSCIYCGLACEHNFVNGICTICSGGCTHNFVDSTCTVCGKACDHNFEYGVCSICGKACEHSFADGKCEICDLPCVHSWKNGICSICGETCEHRWHNGICTVCSTTCSHNWQYGICNICSMQCRHTWDGNTCTVCGSVCEHNYINGSCNICGTVCKKHSFANGYCTICLKACSHNWYDGECIVCGKLCNHSWDRDTCTVCKKVCKHNWHLGSCTVCTVQCEHLRWTDGKCDICATDCDHNFKDSTCTLCGKLCDSHNYADGVCSVCGASKPVYYLCGFINGTDYAIGEDANNIGEYKFEDGKLVVTFTENSYVAVKTSDNSKWYMTNGYQGDYFSLAILYSSDILPNPDKLFVPKGREVTFTLIDNGNHTLTLYYQASPCEHISHNTEGVCNVCGVTVKHNFKNGSCTVCELPCSHSFTDGKCAVCGAVCSHNYANDECTICGILCEHNFTDGNCTDCGISCDHIWVDGICHICDMVCGHNFTDGKCEICETVCEHIFANGKCEICKVYCKHSFKNGKCEICNASCSHSYTDSVCEICGTSCEHSFSAGMCTQCGCSQFYLIGNINRVDIGYNSDYKNLGQYKFENGYVTVNILYDSYVFVKTYDNMNYYMAKDDTDISAILYNTKTNAVDDMLFVPGGVNVTFKLIESEKDILILSYTINNCSHTSHNKDAFCSVCGEKVEHTYLGGGCYICGAQKPQQDMYLFGNINGIDYGYADDAANLGIYKFVDGKLTVTFESNSYVGIKTADNSDWYMTNGWLGENVTTAVLYNTNTSINADKLFVPGGVQVTFSLINNGNDTYTLSYEVFKAPVPVIKTKYITLTYDDELKYKVGFSVLNMDDVALSDMGLAMFSTNEEDGTVLTASKLISGVKQDEFGLAISTDAIHPMYMGDTVYFKVYAKLSDGSYVYSDIMSYSALRYAATILGNKNAPDEIKGMVVAMLNYGAEMQKLFDYKTDKLVNAGLSTKQQNYAVAYSDTMVDKLLAVDSNKASEFAPTGGNALVYPTASFEDTLLTLNFNLLTKGIHDGAVTMYFWSADDFQNVDVLTADNATGSIVMHRDSNGTYTASISGISVMNMNDTIYVSVSILPNQCSGVIAYSMAQFFAANANQNTSDINALSKAAVVYSYYMNLIAN